jgi:hypothetical protein
MLHGRDPDFVCSSQYIGLPEDAMATRGYFGFQIISLATIAITVWGGGGERGVQLSILVQLQYTLCDTL